MQHSSFHYHPKCHRLKLVQLGFADDLMIFCKVDQGPLQVIKDTLDVFSSVSGL